LKTILVACGKALRHFYSQNNETELTLENEMKLVVRSIKPNVKSKLTLSDRQRFEMLMGDVFPQTTENLENLDESIRDKVIESISMMGLSLCEKQVDKCIEIYEQLSKRTGVCLFGPPSSGKSTCIMILKSAFSMMSHKIRTYVISPKSMDRSKLLGFLDLDTRQWHDGVLTQTAVAVNSEPLDVTSWIICDGDVDPEWIEALNSVLDDNKLLTLPSGWRIQFGNNVNFIFETHELSNASPATISRMGIINFSSEDLSPEILIKSWISTKSNGEMLEFLFDKYFSSIFKKLSQLSEM
jgi:dynein heavy chain 2, cytosolic